MYDGNVSIGVMAARDDWVIGFNSKIILDSMKTFVETFNNEQNRIITLLKQSKIISSKEKLDFAKRNVTFDKTKSNGVKILLKIVKGTQHKIDDNIRDIMYRPFVKKKLYFDPIVLDRIGKWLNITPTKTIGI